MGWEEQQAQGSPYKTAGEEFGYEEPRIEGYQHDQIGARSLAPSNLPPQRPASPTYTELSMLDDTVPQRPASPAASEDDDFMLDPDLRLVEREAMAIDIDQQRTEHD